MLKSFLKMFLYSALVIVFLIVSGLMLLPQLVSEQQVKAAIKNLVDERTNKKVEIGGNALFSLFPTLAVSLGKVSIFDEETGEKESYIPELNLSLSLLAAFTGSTSASLEAEWKGVPVAVKASISDLDKIITNKGSSKIDLVVSKPYPTNLTGEISNINKVFSVNDIKFSMENTKAEGNIEIKSAGVKKAYSGSLVFNKLDVDEVFALLASLRKQNKPQGGVTPNKQPVSVQPNQSEQKNMDLSVLNEFNAKFYLKADSITVSGIEVGKTNLSFNVENGILHATISESKLYSGSAVGDVKVDGSNIIPRISGNVTLTDVNVGRVLQDFFKFKRLEGNGDVNISVASSGRNLTEIMHNMDGKGSAELKDGLLKGIDVMAMAGNSQEQITKAFNSINDTKIDELSFSFDMRGGIAYNEDLLIKVPFATIGGKGTVDLAEKTVNYRVSPKVGNRNFGISGPFFVKGKFDSLAYIPDVAGIITENADQLKIIQKNKQLNKINEALEKTLGTGLEGILGGILGGGSNKSSSPPNQ